MSFATFYEQNKTDLTEIDYRMLLVADRVQRFSPHRVLDIACGRGTMLKLIRRRLPNAQLMGVDISQGSVQAARDAGLAAFVADVEKELPFPEDSFDCVIFGEVIEHLVDPDHALVEISRVLRVGGILVLTTPNIASWFNRALLLLGIQPIFTETSLHVNLGRKVRALGQWNPVQGHLKIFTLAALTEMLRANGYRVESIDGAPFVSKTALAIVDRIIARIPSLASNFVVVARNSAQRETIYEHIETHPFANG